MEPRARVELAACRLRIGCSTTELPRPLIIKDLFPSLASCVQLALDPIVLSGFRRGVASISNPNCIAGSEPSCALLTGDRHACASETPHAFPDVPKRTRSRTR